MISPLARPWRAAWGDQLLLALLAGFSTYLVIGDFGVRLANTSTDDGLVAVAYLFKFPELFARDAHMVHWGRMGLASMLNWLPAVLFKYAEVPPEFFFWLFTFLQGVLLALAIYRLAMVMVQNREAALIAAVFTLTFQPHWWNMGLFGDLNWMPYGAWLALPFLVFAGAFALEGRRGVTAVMLLVGGLVHPVLGLFACAMIGLYWVLLSLREQRASELLAPLMVLGGIVVVFLVPVVLVKLGVDEVSPAEILPAVLGNNHAIPWANPACAFCMPLFVKSAIVVPVMAALALIAAAHAGAHPRLRLFLAASTAVAVGACLLHVAAYFAQNVTVLRAISTRSTILLLAFAVPPVAWLAWRVISGAESTIARFLACYAIAWPTPAGLLATLLVLPSSPVLSRGAPDRKSGLLRICRILGISILILVLLRYLPTVGVWIDTNVIGRFLDPAFLPALFGVPSARFHTLVVAYLCVLVAWDRIRSRLHADSEHRPSAPRGIAPLAIALMAPLAGYLLVFSYQNGQASTSGEARDYYEVQVWARSATTADATFIVGNTSVYEGWRNYTHRAQISAGGCGFYFCSRASLETGRKVSAFTDRHGNPREPTVSTEGLRAFARTFGGDYAVRRKAWPPLDFPIAFQNQAYVVYDLR